MQFHVDYKACIFKTKHAFEIFQYFVLVIFENI